MKRCGNCNKDLLYRHQTKFCSNKCQIEFQYRNYIEEWKKGKKNGGRGIVTRDISPHIKKYLMEKYKGKCSECGWNKKHPITGRVPLEVDHVDGNSENNKEDNLRLLCPNCHSLTNNYKNLNAGNGRKWRKEKYLKNA